MTQEYQRWFEVRYSYVFGIVHINGKEELNE